MSQYTLAEFIDRTKNRDHGEGLFELENPRFLEVNLDGMVWMKMGAMVAYNGQVKFTRETLMGQGLGNLLKKAVSGEGAQLTKAEGVGAVYLADAGKKIIILRLTDEAIVVNGNDVLAFEPQITCNIKMMKKVTAMMAGGLFNVRLEGSGLVAITTHYDPITLHVSPDNPVITDPNAPNFKKDMSFKTFLGRGSGESIQMEFKGEGFVVVQPYEEVSMQGGG